MRDSIGLCAACRHSKVVRNARGSVYHLCALSATDATFPKYPRLPVLSCKGYKANTAADDPHRKQAGH